MTGFIHRTALVGMLAVCLQTACNQDDEKVFKGDGNSELKPATTMLEGFEGVEGLDATTEPATSAADVTYLLKITSNSGAKVCEGEVKVQIMTDFSIKFPEARMQCASLTVDMGGILSTGGGMGGANAGDKDLISHDGEVLSIKNISYAEFNPPRPFLLGPIVQDSSKYKNFKRKSDHSVTARDPAEGGSFSGQGSFNIEVLDEETTYENKYVGKAFDKVLHWQMTKSGFEGVPAKYGLLFDRWEWLWNVRPIMIPKIVIVGTMSDFISGEGTSVADQIVGQIEIALTVKDYKIAK